MAVKRCGPNHKLLALKCQKLEKSFLVYELATYLNDMQYSLQGCTIGFVTWPTISKSFC